MTAAKKPRPRKARTLKKRKRVTRYVNWYGGEPSCNLFESEVRAIQCASGYNPEKYDGTSRVTISLPLRGDKKK